MKQNTSLAVVKQKPRALEVMASRLSMEPSIVLSTLKATVFQKATNEELGALVVVANEYDLNPFLKEIYAFPAKGGGIVPVVSIDGWIKMTNRHRDFDGVKFAFTFLDDGVPDSCTATIFVKNRSHPVEVTEYFEECRRNTDPWNNMPRRMLRHKALMQCARVAFGFSGMHDDDEAIDIVSTVVTTEPEPVGIKQVMDANRPASQERKTPPSEPVKTVHGEFETMLAVNGFTFADFQKWAVEAGTVENADSLTMLEEVPAETLTRLLRARNGLLSGLKQAKEAK